MDELKPCPFCGGNAMLIASPSIGIVYIQCQSCTAMVGRKRKTISSMIGKEYFVNKKEAIEAWNSRVVGKTNMPMGSLTYAIACRICKNRDSDKCAACKMEIQSGFELDEDAFKEALVDG